MDNFLLNRFLINPLYFLGLLILLLLVFSLLMKYCGNLSKIQWKKVDYIWLAAAFVGLLGVSADVRIETAKRWVEIEKSYATGILNSLERRYDNPIDSLVCQLASSVNYSFESKLKNEDYLKACKWRKEVSLYLKGISKEVTSDIGERKMPSIKVNILETKEDVAFIKASLKDYNAQLVKLNATLEETKRDVWDDIFSYFSPFLLCFALAVRIIKVKGEIKLET